MEAWDLIKSKFIETPKEMEAFLNDIVEVYERHGLSLSHEDCHGAFIVEDYNERNVRWIRNAHKGYRR